MTGASPMPKVALAKSSLKERVGELEQEAGRCGPVCPEVSWLESMESILSFHLFVRNLPNNHIDMSILYMHLVSYILN